MWVYKVRDVWSRGLLPVHARHPKPLTLVGLLQTETPSQLLL